MISSTAVAVPATRKAIATLNSAEQHDFELIVHSAKQSGWLDDSCLVTAARTEFEAIVTFVGTAGTQTRAYEWNSGWLYRFLRDLAHGYAT